MIGSTRALGVLAAAALSLSLAPAAGADEIGPQGSFMWRHGGWHATGGFRGDWVKAPSLTTGLANRNAVHGGLPIFFTHDIGRLAIFGFEGEVGYAFRAGALPPWLGANTRVAVFGRYGASGSQNAQAERFSQTGWSVVSVDGSRLVDEDDPSTLRSGARLQETRAAFGLRATTDYALAPSWILTPEIGGQFGWSRRTYRIAEDLDQNDFVRTANLKLRSDDVGGVLGLRLTWRPTHFLAVHVGGRVALLARRTKLDASDCMGTDVGGANTIICSGSVYTTATANTRTVFAAVPAGEIGVAYSPNAGTVIRLVGGIEFDTKSPGVRLPTATNRAAASVIHGSTVNYTIQAQVTVLVW